MLPLLRPYVLAACQMRKKKKKPFKHCQKNQLRFHLPALETEKKKKKKGFIPHFLVNISKNKESAW